MSDSRLEKFIYAICSMDASDLPVPLSRIEKLWNCLITGETPDFEPLSRNEKYLMAMLDRYDISNLPAPMSRGEKLLYKIAVGETDLSDVPGYLSRYEELLKYLIENGGISGGDFEYVLYTLNQSLSTLYLTAEKPVKCAILKGQTLVNLSTVKTSDFSGGRFIRIPLSRTLTNGKKYIVKLEEKDSTLPNGFSARFRAGTSEGTTGIISLNTPYTITADGFNYFELLTKNADDITNGYNSTVDNITILEYVDGMENWDIPYFEGMQSVKMPVLTTRNKGFIGIDKSYFINSTPTDKSSFTYYEFSKIYENVTLNSTTSLPAMRLMYLDKNYIVKTISNADVKKMKLEVDSIRGVGFFGDGVSNGDKDVLVELLNNDSLNVWLEYKDIKTNILTVNEEVELRGIGDVKDTLDCLTGEVVERIGEIVLNGNSDETWVSKRNITINDIAYLQYYLVSHPISSKNCSSAASLPNIISDKGITDPFNGLWLGGSVKTISVRGDNGSYYFCMNFPKNEDIEDWLSQNPITIFYHLETESIKTVDLTTVDQDNQPTQLGTFENITYVSLKAENLIPEVEMEVATRISEELASASPLMDDISTKQEQLNTTVDEQSENVDATMIATTEIFEETL